MQADVSVIIPCYCSSETVERAVSSVFNQTMLPREVLLVNDCSDDAGLTYLALKKTKHLYGSKFDIRLFQLDKNLGPAACRNFLWEKAYSHYVAFLDADDSWHPQKLEIQYKIMEARPNTILTGHLSQVFTIGSLGRNFMAAPKVNYIKPNQLLFSNIFPTRSVMLKKDIPFRFDEGKRHAEDYHLWLQIVLSGGEAVLIESPLAFSYKRDFGDQGLTKNLLKMYIGELDTFLKLYRCSLITLPRYLYSVILFSFKYFRRLLITSCWSFSEMMSPKSAKH